MEVTNTFKNTCNVLTKVLDADVLLKFKPP